MFRGKYPHVHNNFLKGVGGQVPLGRMVILLFKQFKDTVKGLPLPVL